MDFYEIVENEFNSLEEKCDIEKYKLTPRAFTQNGTWYFFDYILFILTNKGKSLTLEIEDFVEKHFNDDEDYLISKEAVSKQRQKFSADIFKDMNKRFIKEFYKSEEYKTIYDDYIILIADGSKSEIPNTPESKEWANIEDNSLTNKKALRVLFSTIIDAKYNIILDSIIGKYDSNERDFFKEHIHNIRKIIDLSKVILILDAGYYSLELKLFLEQLGIKYIFRLPTNIYNKEIVNMHSMDEEVNFSNTARRRRNIKDENLLKKAEQMVYITGRVIKVPIINEDDEEEEMRLLTNLPKNKFNTYEICGLYKDRWEIEVNYDKLKNKMEIENYSGKLELTISQDFYSSIYIFNLAMMLRNSIQDHMIPKNKKKLEKEGKEYRTNFNVLVGRVKNKLIKLFTSSTEKIKEIYNRIIERGLKTTYLYDYNRPKTKWHVKIFIGKYRFNQRRNI